MKNIKAILNPVIARWLEPVEIDTPQVDCDRCTRSLETASARWHLYKCCTFQPYVANFYCGAMLEEGLNPLAVEPGKAVLQPLGVIATKEYREFYYSTTNDERGEDHLCSFYDRELRQCKIWKYRPGECALYFCAGSQNSKREKLSKKVFTLESSLAQMALAYYGLSPSQLSYQVTCLNSPEPQMPSLKPSEAEEIYRFSWAWLKIQDPEEVLSWLPFDKVDADG